MAEHPNSGNPKYIPGLDPDPPGWSRRLQIREKCPTCGVKSVTGIWFRGRHMYTRQWLPWEFWRSGR